jgi:conflict system STAND superfamily ATPase/TIR domain-containing protein
MIFISHSSRNNEQAILVRDWLVEQGWGFSQIFLDLDNLYTGDRWRQALNNSSSGCEAVIACLSDDWIRSAECLREFNFAESAGKPIFPVAVAHITERIPTFVTDLQITDLADPRSRTEGFTKLRSGLLAARIGPQYFLWPPRNEPERSPYRGLKTLETKDAAIFFGRDAAITKGLDTLRRIRDSGAERLMVILGASGAGKSSFLRAGLLSRLARDEEHFLVLPVVRPVRAAMSGPTGLLSALGIGGKLTPDALHQHFADLRAPVMARFKLLTNATHADYTHKPPTLILPIDQGEELFISEGEERIEALTALATVLRADPNLIAIVTIRSDSFSQLQNDPQLSEIARVPFDLPRLSLSAFKEVIEGPGRLTDPPIRFESALTDKLITDLNAADALPLLAFTLERLVTHSADDGLITLNDYETGLGGLEGAIDIAVEDAFNAAITDPTLPHERTALNELARRSFIPWLVRVDDVDAAPKRRSAAMSEIPDDARPLIRHLVDQRLLVADIGKNKPIIEVSHEAVLRNWRELARWIAEERHFLRALDTLREAASEFCARSQNLNDEDHSTWLIHRGERLAEANALVQREGFAEALNASDYAYLRACNEQEKKQDKIRRIEHLRYTAINRHTRSFLEEELNQLSLLLPSIDHFGVQEELRTEIEMIRALLGKQNRWHPEAPVFVQSTGAMYPFTTRT